MSEGRGDIRNSGREGVFQIEAVEYRHTTPTFIETALRLVVQTISLSGRSRRGDRLYVSCASEWGAAQPLRPRYPRLQR